MKSLTCEELSDIYNSEVLKTKYEEYCNNNQQSENILNFINNIKLNEKYFRLTTNNKIGKNKRFRNKNVSNDTLALKEVNSLLNKLTDTNIDIIIQKIKDKLKDKNNLKRIIIVNILSKCVTQPSYNKYFIKVLISIYSDFIDIVNKEIIEIENKIQTQVINKEQSEYMQFCDKNKKLDLLIGYFLLITELEKSNIINDKIIPSINNLLELIENNNKEDLEEKFKCSHCLYNICKSYYGSNKLPNELETKIKLLIQNEKSNKIKFKLMDINERK